MLNLGCGNRYLTDWTNIDFVSSGPAVMSHNLREGIPFPDNCFDVVYHSHVLEHFSKERGVFFVQECFRVLEPGGILRAVVPDLEEIAKNYVRALEAVLREQTYVNEANYEWSVIELYDQVVRDTSGGEYSAYLKRSVLANEDWVKSRVGSEAWESHRQTLQNVKASPSKDRFRSRLKRRVKALISRIQHSLASILLSEPQLNQQLETLQFRAKGELHQWMFDRHSLAALLQQIGFRETQIVSAFESRIPNWDLYQWLDVEAGIVRKPDSLFMEGAKPV